MVRSLIIIALAIVCGAAAAVGVNQALRRQSPDVPVVDVPTQKVLVATRRIGRGEAISEEMVRTVDWPSELLPGEVIGAAGDAVGRVALSSIVSGEPVYESKLTDETGEGFIASIIKPNMRAYTIQTRGPSATVAGLVRPRDRVDVLVNIRGNMNDETGGGSTTTLLQSVEVLAIDQILDPDADALQMLEMWTKGDDLTSVTLEVTPAQASLLALGQSYGELSLSLRRFGDEQQVDTLPATIRDIRFLEMLVAGDDVSATGESSTDSILTSKNDTPPATYIQTLRGSQGGRVDLVR